MQKIRNYSNLNYRTKIATTPWFVCCPLRNLGLATGGFSKGGRHALNAQIMIASEVLWFQACSL
jgi:hypothetical protein